MKYYKINKLTAIKKLCISTLISIAVVGCSSNNGSGEKLNVNMDNKDFVFIHKDTGYCEYDKGSNTCIKNKSSDSLDEIITISYTQWTEGNIRNSCIKPCKDITGKDDQMKKKINSDPKINENAKEGLNVAIDYGDVYLPRCISTCEKNDGTLRYDLVDQEHWDELKADLSAISEKYGEITITIEHVNLEWFPALESEMNKVEAQEEK